MTEFANMDEPEDSTDPELLQRLRSWWQSGYQAGRDSSERASDQRTSEKRDSQLERAFGATVFWALPFFILCSFYLESSYGWKNETAGWEILMVTSVVVLIFYLTLRVVIGKD
jgi:hypothetical protein